MKSAKELFKELGYERVVEVDDHSIAYYGSDGERVAFYLNYYNYTVTFRHSSNFADKKLQKAITKQLKELGWLE